MRSAFAHNWASRQDDLKTAAAQLASRQADLARARARLGSARAELEAQKRQRAVLDSQELLLHADLNAKESRADTGSRPIWATRESPHPKTGSSANAKCAPDNWSVRARR